MCNILKFTQNSLVLIPYLLNYSPLFFVSITDENLRCVMASTKKILPVAVVCVLQNKGDRCGRCNLTVTHNKFLVPSVKKMIKIGVHLRKLSQRNKIGIPLFGPPCTIQ